MRSTRLAVAIFSALLAACATRPTIVNPAPELESDPPPAATNAGPPDDAMNVWILDVGQGACVIIDCPDNDRPLLIDCGSTARSARNDRNQTIDWVRAQLGEWGAPTIVISHGDADHYGLVPRIVDADATDDVWLGGDRADYGDAFEAWAQDVESENGTVATLDDNYFGPNDADLHCGRSAISDILIANATRGESKNGDSIVVAITYGGVTLVLPGDAEGETERQALINRATLPHLQQTRAIVVGSHHGARTLDSNSDAWAAEWRPYATIFSQKPSSYGHPACDVARRYASHMRNSVGMHRVPCGSDGYISTATRMLTTSGNGDILVRITRDLADQPSRLEIFCQNRTAGCTGPLPSTPTS